MELPAVNAPEIDTPHGWLNSPREKLSIKDFRGKILLLDFWTYGCINCQHIQPELKKLTQEYTDEVVVVGIHSGKFHAEKDTPRIRQAILRMGIQHPVVNDADYTIWQAYGIRAWPTVVVISPDSKVVGQKAGEGIYEPVKALINILRKKHRKALDKRPFPYQNQLTEAIGLQFPTKLFRDHRGHLFIADTGNHRILKTDTSGKIIEQIGSGEAGFKDGWLNEAMFRSPRGMVVSGRELYVADTDNHALRKVDLLKKRVETVSGNGQKGHYFFDKDWDKPILPNSPWDLTIAGEYLFVANAGNHQILKMHLLEETLFRFAGSGQEALHDGTLEKCGFCQPSGITWMDNRLWVLDTEASALRHIDWIAKKVGTTLGKGLFYFGDEDGLFKDASLQHPAAITHRNGRLYIADTYNGKVKVADLDKKEILTLVDGLEEPEGIFVDGSDLWVSNTNRHEIWRISLITFDKEVIRVLG